MVGCLIRGWDIFHGGSFQTGDFNNQSVNLTPVVRFFAAAKNPPTSAGYLRVVLRILGGTRLSRRLKIGQ